MAANIKLIEYLEPFSLQVFWIYISNFPKISPTRFQYTELNINALQIWCVPLPWDTSVRINDLRQE